MYKSRVAEFSNADKSLNSKYLHLNSEHVVDVHILDVKFLGRGKTFSEFDPILF